ncbi:MAG: hypothetical protein ABW133_00720, partial [Polyangiaceae bacterium]
MERQTMKQRISRTLKLRACIGVVAMAGLFGACAVDQAPQPVPDDTLVSNDPFVAIAREGTESRAKAVEQVRQSLEPVDAHANSQSAQPAAAPPPVNQPGRAGEFYLAINRAELGNRWFMSGYLGQYYPGGVAAGAAMSLGTRVVSFRVQNGKLFLFDVDDRKKVSGTFDPQVVVDAYPIVTDYEPFN